VCRLPFMICVPFYTPQTVTASGSIIGGHLNRQRINYRRSPQPDRTWLVLT